MSDQPMPKSPIAAKGWVDPDDARNKATYERIRAERHFVSIGRRRPDGTVPVTDPMRKPK